MEGTATRNDEFSHQVSVLRNQSPWVCEKAISYFLVIHYMDDILFSALSSLETQHMFDIAQLCLKNSGLIIAPEKIQTSTPYHYLGFVVNRLRITPQLMLINHQP